MNKMLLRFVELVVVALAVTICEGSKQQLRSTSTTTTATTITTTKGQQQEQQSSHHRKLVFDEIAGYEPLTLVTDHNAIDLDVFAIEDSLLYNNIDGAYNIYTEGSYSKSVATLTLLQGLPTVINAKTPIEGKNSVGDTIKGQFYETYPVGTTTVRIQYKANELQSKYTNCHVGGNPKPTTDGCFAPTGTIEINTDDQYIVVGYTYTVLLDNFNERTIQKFSIESYEKMYICDSGNCPYVDYEKFYNYYKIGTYGDTIISSAYNKLSTDSLHIPHTDTGLIGDTTGTDTGSSLIDFTYASDTIRQEAIRKTIKLLIIWMYVIREMEDSIDDCEKGCITTSADGTCYDDIVHAWDEAVAFYTGSMEGEHGSHGQGVLLYKQAELLCRRFNTCSKVTMIDEQQEAKTITRSKVNIEIFEKFKIGQNLLKEKKCNDVRAIKERIVQLMIIPNIQDTLYFAYQLSQYNLDSMDGQSAQYIKEYETFTTNGVIAAASILPYIYHCNAIDASILYNNLKYNSNNDSTMGNSVDFNLIKSILEKNYDCLGITCNDIGGIIHDATGTYYDNTYPCNHDGGGAGGTVTTTTDGGTSTTGTTTTTITALPPNEGEGTTKTTTTTSFVTKGQTATDGKIIGLTVGIGFIIVALLVIIFNSVGPKPAPFESTEMMKGGGELS